MRFISGKITAQVVTALFTICLFCLAFPDIAFRPWHCVPATGGDGGKNLFTYLYHILYGSGLRFTGMNYPYGEHIMYTDGQALLSVPLSAIPGISIEIALTIMWYAIMGSYVFGAVFLYRILAHFKVPQILAIILAGIICISTPQALRLAGNYSLAYACVLPGAIYWLIQYEHTRRRKHLVWLALFTITLSFIHAYFSALVFVFLGMYCGGVLLFRRGAIASHLRYLIPIIIAAVAIVGVMGVFMKLTDPVTDRPQGPYGMLVYCSSLSLAFTSAYSPIWQWVRDAVPDMQLGYASEGYVYLGLVAMTAMLAGGIVWLVARIRRRQVSSLTENGPDAAWLFVAIAALLFSMGAPFIWGLETLPDHLSVFRQFRTLGRFSWICYYVVSVWGAVLLSRAVVWLSERGRKIAAGLLAALALLVWAEESIGYVRHVREGFAYCGANHRALKGTEDNDWAAFLREHHYQADSFQAILLLRFFAVGSDKLWLGREVSQHELVASFMAGIQLHLPSVDIFMSRTSWAQTQAQVKIAGGPFTDKPMLRDLKSNKPFLLLNVDYDRLDPDQSYLLQASDSIGKFHEWYVYACYPDRIRQNDDRMRDSVNALLAGIPAGTDTCIGVPGSFYINHFDTGQGRPVLSGTGAFNEVNEDVIHLLTVPVSSNDDSGRLYELSCWYLLDNDDYRSPYITLEFLDSAGNKTGVTDMLTKESTDSRGMWFRGYLYFNMPAGCRSIKMMLYNERQKSYKVLDELLLRPADALIISRSKEGQIMVNNHLFPAEAIR